MKIHPAMATAILTAVLSLQAWELSTLSKLSNDVSALRVEVSYLRHGSGIAANPQPNRPHE